MKKLNLIALLALFVSASLLLSKSTGSEAAAASISGIVWNDENADGVKQLSEPLEQWPIELQASDGSKQVLYRHDGNYSFSGLAPGTYTVRLEFGAGGTPFFLTYPERKGVQPYEQRVTLQADQAAMADFGVFAPRDIPRLTGLAWIDAVRVPDHDVRALINGVDCTGPGGIMPTDQDEATYLIGVVSSVLIPECGEPGKTIVFTINGRTANETVIWQSPQDGFAAPQRLDLTVGAPFAYFFPLVHMFDEQGREILGYSAIVGAFIDDRLCAVSEPAGYGGSIMVLRSELTGGCGREGATIRFGVDGVRAAETATWHPGGAEVTLTATTSPNAAKLGPAFAYYHFSVDAGVYVNARIGNTYCGQANADEAPGRISVAVRPLELAAGCGYAGAQITFNAYVQGIGVIGEATAVWQPGDHEVTLDVAASGVPPPSGTLRGPDTGDGGLVYEYEKAAQIARPFRSSTCVTPSSSRRS